ncbi:MAG: ABC transporter permease [Thermoplasmatota archaeon]
MDIRDAVSITSTSVRTHKLRSTLSIIGVVLGISSVIAIVTLGAGLQTAILSQVTQQFDPNVISVSLVARSAGVGPGGGEFAAGGGGSVFAFTDHDISSIQNLSGVDWVGATAPLSPTAVRLGNQSLPGITVSAHRGLSGNHYQWGHDPTGANEAVLSNATALRLLNLTKTSNVSGLVLTLEYPAHTGAAFAWANVTVVGVQTTGVFGGGGETMVVGQEFAPLAPLNGTAQHGWTSLTVRATDQNSLNDVKTRVSNYLNTQSDARNLKGDRLNFQLLTQDDVVSLISNGLSTFTLVIAGIGAVALLVGLVGIANIMLVSVQERTREIGIMKAVGANRTEILMIFLVESVVVCVVGAILGIILGTFEGFGLGRLLATLGAGRGTGFPFVLLPEWYGIAVLLGILVGLVAGIYPASRAGRVSPVEALRYE